jgi:hypothetical protein
MGIYNPVSGTFSGGTVANATTFSSLVTLGAGLDAGDGNISNVGSIALDTITSDAGAGITITPTTDTFFSLGTGIVLGHTAQITGNNTAEFQMLGNGGSSATILIGRFKAGSQPGNLHFIKSRNDTIGSNTIVNDNDNLGEISWFPADGVDFATRAARFKVEVDDGSPAAGDIGTAFLWQQMAGGGAAIADTMRLDAKGNLTLSTGSSIFLKEKADADADVAGYGQIWVNTATPNELWWTNDAGTDAQLGAGGGAAAARTGFSTIFEDIHGVLVRASGTGAAVALGPDAGTRIAVESGTTTSSFANFSILGWQTDAGKLNMFDGNPEVNFYITTDNRGSENGRCIMALVVAYADSLDETTNNKGWWFTHDVTSGTGKLFTSNADGSTNTNTDVSSGLTLNTGHHYYMVGTDGTDVKFYVDQTLEATHTTNLPTGQTTTGNFMTVGQENDGTGTEVVVYAKYMEYSRESL